MNANTKSAVNDNGPAAMHLEARNVRGVREVETDLDGITLIAGRNGAGKSSLAQAIAAAVTGCPPLAGLKKSELHLLLRAGTAAGQAVISTASGRSAWGIPDGKVETTGATPPQASRYAAGIVSVLDLAPKDAADALACYIDAEPKKEDLLAALPDLETPDLETVWEDIESTGWDGAYTNAREDGARTKGKWEQVTGERYGVKKAAQWSPEGYVHNGAGTAEGLRARVQETQAAYARAIQAAAVSGAALAELKRKADFLPELRRALEAQEACLARAKDTEAEAEKALESAKGAVPGAAMTCPHCGGAVCVTGGNLTAAVEPDPYKVAAARQELDSRAAAWNVAKNATREAEKATHETRDAIKEAEEAARKLETGAADDGALSVELAQRYLDEARRNLDGFTRYTTAHELHKLVLTHAAIVAALAPDGVRASCLKRALTSWNKTLSDLSTVAGFPPVRFEHDLGVSAGDRPYMLLSESEQYRARAIVQAAQAKADGSALVIYDRADLLDREGRNGLFRLVRHLGIPAVICMTADAPDSVPNLATKGMGRTIWLNSGEQAA